MPPLDELEVPDVLRCVLLLVSVVVAPWPKFWAGLRIRNFAHDWDQMDLYEIQTYNSRIKFVNIQCTRANMQFHITAVYF